MDARGINWYKGTGIGTYTYNVLKNLINDNKEDFYNIYWSGKDYEEFMDDNTQILMASKKHHRFFEQHFFPSNLQSKNIDLFHIPQNGIGLTEYVSCKKVVTIHDLIPYLMPETVGKGYLLKFLEELPKIIKLSDGIITVSEWSKKDIAKFFPNTEDKIFVTPLAADKKYKPLNKEHCREFLKKTYGINKPFILYIGGFSPRKNVKSLILAFSSIFNSLNKEYELVIVGANKDDSTYLNILGQNVDIGENIIFTGFVPENHLPILYNGSDVFAYPSLYEGFGLPPLEAMSCGTPVISSNISSIPEVVEDAGVLINPFNIDELKNALVSVLNNDSLKTSLSIKGLERSKFFSWQKTAKQTLDVYKKIISETNKTAE